MTPEATHDFVVVVSAGTYHLPFDRLIDWVEEWAAANPDATLIVQHGTSRAARGAINHVMVSPEQLAELYRRADVLVLQGGAGGVMDARRLGVKPVVVPRVPGSGEVVDDHQLVFTRRLAADDVLYVAESAPELSRLLDAARQGTLVTRTSPGEPTPGTVVLLGRLDTLPQRLAGWATLRRALGSSQAIAIDQLRRFRR